MTIANVLTIAGSDSGGGAGIQADLKTFSALGVYGASVVTALTAQNTRGVTAVHIPDADFVSAQLDAVFEDIRIDAVKIGMLGNAAVVEAVAAGLRRWQPRHVVLDTVMISKSGHALLDPAACDSLRDTLMPLATLVTPNLPEAAALLGVEAASDEQGMQAQGQALLERGAQAVLIKGGHLGGKHSPDWLMSADETRCIDGPRIEVSATHGTGCTLSSAIAALLARGETSLSEAVSEAKLYLVEALRHAGDLEVGQGVGPLHHFHRWW